MPSASIQKLCSQVCSEIRISSHQLLDRVYIRYSPNENLLFLTYSADPNLFDQPIFKLKADSILYQKVDMALQQKMEAEIYNPKEVDSLLNLARRLRDLIIGYRRIFTPNPDFLPFDSLPFSTNKLKVHRLSLVGVKSKKLPAQIFACKNLEELELVNTSIAKAQRKLSQLKKLRVIYIYNNQPLKSLKLKRNCTVTKLIVRGERPEKLPKSYAGFKALHVLDLAQNALSVFPSGTHKIKNLKELILNTNGISLENEKLNLHRSLEKLDLGKNQIRVVPKTIGQFPNLKVLKFNHNQISKVDDAISGLKSLEQVSFYTNQLPVIPSGLYALKNLKEIDLYYNRIERVDSSIANWGKLEILYLAFNKIYSLPQNWNALTNLHELYLHNNRLSFVAASISDLPNLKTLRVNNNLITELPSSFFQFNSLEYLDVSNNALHELPIWKLHFPKLKILSLVANPWDAETKKNLLLLTKSLREKGVIVHLNSFDESIE